MTNANCNIFQKLWKKIIKGKFIFKQGSNLQLTGEHFIPISPSCNSTSAANQHIY